VNQTVTLANTWKDYTLSFAAAEAEAALGRMQLSFTATGANVELDDVSLAQANSSPDNPTVFRDEVVNALKEMNPGTIRMAAGSGARGSDILNQLQAPFARYREGFSPYETAVMRRGGSRSMDHDSDGNDPAGDDGVHSISDR